MYISVMFFTGLGDQDMYCATQAEAIATMIYCLFNVVMGAYILGEGRILNTLGLHKNGKAVLSDTCPYLTHAAGTVTMLMVKGDERSKAFRDQTTSLNDYSKMNELPEVCVCACACACA